MAQDPPPSRAVSPTGAGEEQMGTPLDASLQRDIEKLCDAVTEKFSRGTLSFATATRQIWDAIRGATTNIQGVTELQLGAIHESYINILNNTRAVNEGFDRNGQHASGVQPPRRKRTATGGDGPGDPDGSSDEDGDGEPRDRRPPVKRTRGLDDDTSGPRGKRDFDPSLVPFASALTDEGSFRGAGFIQPSPYAADIADTLKLKFNYLADLTHSTNLVCCAPTVPEFPRALWRLVLSNDYIDFGKIFTAAYATDVDHRETVGKYGDLELSLDRSSAKSARHIGSHGEWSIAFKAWRKAVVFAYPHRGDELDAYEMHITELFVTLPHAASSILTYDRAVRVHAASRNDIYLGDEGQFRQLHLRYIVNRAGGGGGPSAPGPSRKNGQGSLESRLTGASNGGGNSGQTPICRRWNNGQSRTPSSSAPTRSSTEWESELQTRSLPGPPAGPRLNRGFLWEEDKSLFSFVTPSASATEMADPVPAPPEAALHDSVAAATLASRPDLFSIVTPVNIIAFEAHLSTHPNRAYVASVVRGLREGFWPYIAADLEPPVIRDFPERSLTPEHLAFAVKQRDVERSLDRFSAPFKELLPGMINVPVHVVPKQSGKLRLVVDHSAGDDSPNSFIPKHDVHVKLDTVRDLMHNLLVHRRRSGNKPVWIFKSDVSQAYRRMPIHPLAQLRQIVTIDGERSVDRCNNFGGRGSGTVFCSFMALVVWIAVNVYKIEGLLAYIDDCFGFDDSEELEYYEPYDTRYPPKQVALLRLWDALGIPHEKEKQEYGRSQVVTGLEVDSARLTVKLPDDKRIALVQAVRAFISEAPRRQRRLVEWERIIGWMNWAVTVAPLLRPALTPGYDKIGGKHQRNARIYLNAEVKRDFAWFADVFESWDGLHAAEARIWTPDQADLSIFCDACMSGLGFWTPNVNRGFAGGLPELPPGVSGPDTIYWYEAICVLRALAWAVSLPNPPRRLAIFTDNLNTVQVFNSLKAHGEYNSILLLAARLRIESRVDLRVSHIPGVDNSIADALSRGLLSDAQHLAPRLVIHALDNPSWMSLGAAAC
ncbi:unnamed protein product [Peniophora sp. CBMAI 1063]|nr:unnamed protein product [Peniophora sp. CBMAI 1063]